MGSETFKMINLINKKKCGEAHTKEEIFYIIEGVTNDTIPDYQLASWLMAVCLKGMNFDESAALTEAMAKSGDILDLSALGEYVIDKHSTGGVGDKATLVLIPLLAAAGMPSAKLSGRGLGFTGGTIDKLESIPGFNPQLELEDFIAQVKNVGGAIASQTAKLTPADARIYSLRDVTCTVESIPLIASSVLSKKIAAGANVIVLDVKCGNGAFMKNLDEARELSRTMVEIGKKLNKSITAVITSMEQPLGKAIGNSLEIIESIETLKNQGPDDLRDLSLYLGAQSLLKSKQVSSIQEGIDRLKRHLEDGSALEKFKEIVKAQSGDETCIENPEKLPTARLVVELKADQDGYIEKVDALTVAKSCKYLGAGRDKKGDPIDYSVGVILNKKAGDSVTQGELLAKMYANSENLVNQSLEILKDAFVITSNPVKKPDLILEVVD